MSPENHAPSVKGLTKRRPTRASAERRFHCHCCGRSWRSTRVPFQGSNECRHRKCYGCGTQVTSSSLGVQGSERGMHYGTQVILREHHQVDQVKQPERNVQVPSEPSVVRERRAGLTLPVVERGPNTLKKHVGTFICENCTREWVSHSLFCAAGASVDQVTRQCFNCLRPVTAQNIQVFREDYEDYKLNIEKGNSSRGRDNFPLWNRRGAFQNMNLGRYAQRGV